MITGAHFLLYSDDAEADRAFIRDVLGFRPVDAGEGWLIFALPPSEMAVHPTGGKPGPAHAGRKLSDVALYLMCDSVRGQVELLAARGVACTAIEEAPWGVRTTIPLPSGGEIGLYEPRHPTAIDLGRR